MWVSLIQNANLLWCFYSGTSKPAVIIFSCCSVHDSRPGEVPDAGGAVAAAAEDLPSDAGALRRGGEVRGPVPASASLCSQAWLHRLRRPSSGARHGGATCQGLGHNQTQTARWRLQRYLGILHGHQGLRLLPLPQHGRARRCGQSGTGNKFTRDLSGHSELAVSRKLTKKYNTPRRSCLFQIQLSSSNPRPKFLFTTFQWLAPPSLSGRPCQE